MTSYEYLGGMNTLTEGCFNSMRWTSSFVFLQLCFSLFYPEIFTHFIYSQGCSIRQWYFYIEKARSVQLLGSYLNSCIIILDGNFLAVWWGMQLCGLWNLVGVLVLWRQAWISLCPTKAHWIPHLFSIYQQNVTIDIRFCLCLLREKTLDSMFL